MPTNWALLIGVDFYFRAEESPGPRGPVEFSNLRGCVRDVSRVEDYLKKLTSHADLPRKFKIKKLTASVGIDNEPQEREQTLPTYDNIEREIDAIHDAAQSGDLVYIHYSGHGILRKDGPRSDNESGDAISGTALALTDVMRGGAYLTGHRLGVWARKLIKLKKVRVVIILDSCHSGKALRAGGRTDNAVDKWFNLRTSESHPVDMSSLDSDARARMGAQRDEDLIQQASGNRNGTVTTNDWLSNPKGCTILTACQLDQQAGEFRFKGQDGYNGILTHWVLDLVSNYAPLGPYSYEGLTRHVISRTRSTGRPQTAVLHGESSFEFLGHRRLNQRSACLVQLKDQPGKDDKLFQVHVGAAQGVAAGSSYDIYNASSNFQQNANGGQRALVPRQIRINNVFPLFSEATLADAEKPLKRKDIRNGDCIVAVLNCWSLPQQLQSVIERLEEKIESLPRLSPPSRPDLESPSTPFNIAIDDSSGGIKGFHIETIQGKFWKPAPRVPFIPLDDPDAKSKVSYMLRHLARFHALVKHDYGRPNAFRTRGYKFWLMEAGKPHKGVYKTKHGQNVVINFKNTSSDNVHIAIFMFNGTWGVERLWPNPKDARTTIHLASQTGEESFTMTMKVPQEANETDGPEVYDLIRAYVYVGNYPLSWDEICQPDIPPCGDSVPTDVLVALPKTASENVEESRNADVLREPRGAVPNLENGQWAALDLKVRTIRCSVSMGGQGLQGPRNLGN